MAKLSSRKLEITPSFSTRTTQKGGRTQTETFVKFTYRYDGKFATNEQLKQLGIQRVTTINLAQTRRTSDLVKEYFNGNKTGKQFLAISKNVGKERTALQLKSSQESFLAIIEESFNPSQSQLQSIQDKLTRMSPDDFDYFYSKYHDDIVKVYQYNSFTSPVGVRDESGMDDVLTNVVNKLNAFSRGQTKDTITTSGYIRGRANGKKR